MDGRAISAVAALLAVILTVSARTASAQDDPATTQANRAAYQAAMKCFVVAGTATGERRDAGDTAKAEMYETKARKAFDTAVRLAGMLGYDRDKVDQDFGLAQAQELPKMVKDIDYYRRSAATCRAIGLL